MAHPKTTGQPRHPRVRAAPPTVDRIAGARGRGRGRRASSRAATPTLITDAWWKEERGERIFIDFNQNAPHKTIFGAWCVRAREGAQVSTPFDWSELDTIDADAQTIATVPARVAAARRSVGRHARGTAVDRTAARDVDARPRRTASRTRRGRRGTRRCRASRRASRRAGAKKVEGRVTFKGWPDAALDFYVRLEADNSQGVLARAQARPTTSA